MSTETENKTTETKKSSAKTWVTLVLGIIAIILGCTTLIENDDVNNTLIEIGAAQSATSIIEMQPNAKSSIGVIADVLDAAVEARDAKPEHIAELIQTALQDKIGTVDIRPIVSLVVKQLDEVYKKSSTEERYLEKVTHLAKGFREVATAE